MLNSTYKIKYYLNINHLVDIKKDKKKKFSLKKKTNCFYTKESHPVAFEIVVTLYSKEGGHITFSYLDELLENILGPYQMTQINDVPPFDKIEPNSKNLIIFIKEKIEPILIEQDCEILSIGIGETPLSFCIYNNKNGKYYQRIKTYLNIFHAIEQDGILGEKHEHSLELHCIAIGEFDLKQCVDNTIQFYQGKYLNDLMDFYEINPTLENISIFFKKELSKAIKESGGIFHSLEIAEKSSISYIC